MNISETLYVTSPAQWRRWLSRHHRDQRESMIAGLDLAGSAKRPSGLALLHGHHIHTVELYDDAQIVAAIRNAAAQLVAIDAPLSLPKGRHCVEDDCPCEKNAHFRECDLALRRMGIRFFPITLGPMRALTRRGLRLKSQLEQNGAHVIETYPGAAQDIWKIPRQTNPRGLRTGLRRVLKSYGFRAELKGKSVHELDALTCALVGWLYAQRKHQDLGDSAEGLMILPPR